MGMNMEVGSSTVPNDELHPMLGSMVLLGTLARSMGLPAGQ